MPFDTLSPRLKAVANATFAHCKIRFGTTGAKAESPINKDIGWTPTIQVKSGVKLIAVEVDDNLYPEILKIAAYDISHSDIPIVVYQACSLEAYMLDTKQTVVNRLRKHGFGIITVDDQGTATIQCTAVPLAQHINEDELEKELKGLSPKLKVAFRGALPTYTTDAGQGLQKAGQLVEAIVIAMARAMQKKGSAVNPNKPVAVVIDDIYADNSYKDYRAALGGVRDFIKEFRNTASHPAGSAAQAAEKLRKCKKGFFDALRFARNMGEMAKKEQLALKIQID